ncbi:MAG: DUF1343 domain-containing protein [Thermoproteales archaeon]|nr:DUF1343 domain-containing protein [Thermoproteales archaeon]
MQETMIKPKVTIGLDKVRGEGFKQFKDKKIGLVLNHTSLTSDLVFSLNLFKKHLKEGLEVVFTPEHGLLGDVADGVKVQSYFDKVFRVQVYSLYGETYEPPADVLQDLDALVYDIQDIGVRWYTYISTLYYVIRASGKADTPVYVLDRPNPVTGVHLEGPILDLNFKSFVGIADIPVRYGLTCGELALYYNERFSFGAELHVIKISGWDRKMWFDETGLLWVPPSPNIPSLDAAIVYLGSCIFEGTNLSEGRGTVKPFEYIGAPWLKWRKVLDYLGGPKLPGALLRPVTFTPLASKHKNEKCYGFQVHVYDRETFKPLKAALKLLEAIKNTHEDDFQWRCSKNVCWIDKLLGTDQVRKRMDSGEKVDEYYWELQRGLDAYWEKASKILLY